MEWSAPQDTSRTLAEDYGRRTLTMRSSEPDSMSCPLSSAQAAAFTSSLCPGTRMTTCRRVYIQGVRGAGVADCKQQAVCGLELCTGCQLQHLPLHVLCSPGCSEQCQPGDRTTVNQLTSVQAICARSGWRAPQTKQHVPCVRSCHRCAARDNHCPPGCQTS